MTINPYASPGTAASIVPEATGAEAIRRKYLNHEQSVKSIGLLYMLGAIFMVPFGAFLFVNGFSEQPQSPSVSSPIVGLVYLALGILQGARAVGLRRLSPWARIVSSVFSVIGLIGVPIGTVISAYILYLLLSQKGVYIFSDEYRRIVAETPHIKYRTSIIVVILVVFLVLLLVLGFMALLFRS
jgi:hypothetical protein